MDIFKQTCRNESQKYEKYEWVGHNSLVIDENTFWDFLQ